MKDLTSNMSKTPSRHLRLFIIDILCSKGEFNKWYSINDFKKNYSDYSTTVYDRVLQEIKESNLFDLKKERPIKFRLK